MRSVLPEWYPLTDDQRREIFQSGVIVFDTSSLLTLYRLSYEDRSRVLDLMRTLNSRLWLPYHVGLEFQKNRLKVYHDQLRAYEDIKGSVEKLSNQLLLSLRAHPVLTQSSIRREIGDRLNGIERYIEELKEEQHPKDLIDPQTRDGVRDAMDEIFDGRMGQPTEASQEQLDEAARRYAARIPPGYEDAAKPEPERYGDYLIWTETLSYVSGSGDPPTPLAFVTEDKKEDWWLLDPVTRRRVGPRPELIREAASLGVAPVFVASLRRFFEEGAAIIGWAETKLGEYAPVRDDSGSTEEGDDKSGI